MMLKSLSLRRLWPLVVAGILIVLSWLGLQQARAGLTLRTFEVAGIPMEFIAPRQAINLPGVLITHGFSGSKQLMLGYAYTLAHNGYGVLLWDHLGHGANAQPFPLSSFSRSTEKRNPKERDALQIGADTALKTLKEQPNINAQQLAILGHSMGSRIAMNAGIEHPTELDAVLAISPTDAPVTPNLPKNLSLQAGAWEPLFVQNAERLFQQSGGSNPNLEQGKGRWSPTDHRSSLTIIPNVEHATILFNDASHQAALNWLNQTFNRPQTSHPYRDRRMGYYGLQCLGWLVILGTVTPRLAKEILAPASKAKTWRTWGGLLLAPMASSIILKLMSLGGAVETLGGMLIGGAIGFWFFIAGLSWLGILAQVPRPQVAEIKAGLIIFLVLWVGFGVCSQGVWLPWFLNWPRFRLWILVAIACLPWFLASGMVQQGKSTLARWGWWLGQSLAVVMGLIVTIILLPSLGFMVLLLPLFPLLFGIFAFLAAKLKSPWGLACAAAPFFAWLIMVPFPLLV
jgi:pimeloyl-ACP methyl ester carboxylesterase